MQTKSTIVLLFAILFGWQVSAQNKILFFQTSWGNKLSYNDFCERAKASGFDGVVYGLPRNEAAKTELKNALKKHDLKLNFLLGTSKGGDFEEILKRYETDLKEAVKWKPNLINSHTGSDFFTFEQNKQLVELANKIGKEHNIPVHHETHRGRFSYNLPDTQKYLDSISDLSLTLDISHWMVVHETLLQGKILDNVIQRSGNIHARVGYAEGPQVNDPRAPEWKKALEVHLDIWEAIIKKGWEEHDGVFSVTSEFGPADYMHTLPYTKLPVADQWEINVFIMNAIKERMNIK